MIYFLTITGLLLASSGFLVGYVLGYNAKYADIVEILDQELTKGL